MKSHGAACNWEGLDTPKYIYIHRLACDTTYTHVHVHVYAYYITTVYCTFQFF